ncbi:MAG: hypothetical protein BRC38_12865 [Cyanobacteria bacterium QH_6_48_35]|jgi:iron complex outermembrane receptor protein|nr:MAG: hypothetical protein BRC34_14615 [Cyanobacteria bacterium QH_1_48_107]PSO55082.1 MAG: hypothetical protein BRC35_12855 [Cyanobacteria bacterium QH_10_48_56]PSO56642.1 MAG: hypothetical protein BRC39_16835 [Cyanobacteria bacterium QH_7_48_89]PSO63812.1 MAG: hypothetical protein BRC38_12865 [Cyanobacteria bacterium QH_6_48_35]PSO71972.1 MAG: hypothetical protein BRC37_12715 [Cyanobacteria bacterium QH_3_48_40]PSO75134.1 MAG: hypothetical protein BRC42_01040 [Cyanobacteria bacterium QS_1_
MKLPPEQYTETPLLEIPQSIQVVPEQVIEDQQVQRLDEASRNVNCITPVGPAPRSAFDIFQIRGFDTRNIFRKGLRDDTNVTVGSVLTNVERVEVLKEPASVLYSQGSLGGTINIITEKPLSEPFYSLEGTAGSYDFYRGSLDLSGPLNESETLLYRLNASARNSESFIDFVEIDRHFVAPVLTWLISEDTKITFEPEYLDAQPRNDNGLPAVGTVLPNSMATSPSIGFLENLLSMKITVVFFELAMTLSIALMKIGKCGMLSEPHFNAGNKLMSSLPLSDQITARLSEE